MATGAWKQAVTVNAGKNGTIRYVIRDTAKAAEVLLYQWPVPGGLQYLHARRTALRCLEGACPPEEARDAFVTAAEEAGIVAS